MTERFVAQLAGFFSTFALILACIGLYGLLAYSVTRRTREIGIRVALGAEGRHVRWLVMRESLSLVTLGLIVGLGAAFALTRLIGSWLFGLTPMDPATLLVASSVMVGVGLLAAYLPARRATRVDPIVALR